jgi:hypothetical protein
MNVIFLRRGLEKLPQNQREDHANGVILAFVVDDLEGELAGCKPRACPSPCR